jgi:hypothetical protein
MKTKKGQFEPARAQWFDTRTSIFFLFFFVNEICSWDIYVSIKA